MNANVVDGRAALTMHVDDVGSTPDIRNGFGFSLPGGIPTSLSATPLDDSSYEKLQEQLR